MSNRPETFFKYMTAKVAKIVLVSHKLRWSSPLLFNDPFDVSRNFDFGFNKEELKEALVDEIKNLIFAKQIPDLSINPLLKWLIECLRRGDNTCKTILNELPVLIDNGFQQVRNNSLKELKEQWGKLIPKFRILCFSEECDLTTMWSYYSESHTGVVIELQCIKELDSAWQIAKPVIYQDSPPMMATMQEWIKFMTGQKPLNHYKWKFYEPLVLTKTTNWKHEKEWRIVDLARPSESGHYSDSSFSPREIRSIYLGCEISNEDATDIISVLNYDLSHVNVYKAKKLEYERKLSFERIK